MSRRTRSSVHFGLESLEGRRLLSASVAEAYPGYFEIDGDNSDDVIDISVSMADQTFTLDGTTYSGVTYIVVNGYGGDDFLSIISVDGSGIIGAAINGGSGGDSIVLSFDGAVWGGSGNDVLVLADSFRGEAYGEEGNDDIYIFGACVDAQIIGGDGNDRIDCSGNNYAVLIHGGPGSDTIIGSEHDDQLYGDEGEDIIVGGGGDDEFFFAANDYIDGGDGYDILFGGGSGGGHTGPRLNIEEVIG